MKLFEYFPKDDLEHWINRGLRPHAFATLVPQAGRHSYQNTNKAKWQHNSWTFPQTPELAWAQTNSTILRPRKYDGAGSNNDSSLVYCRKHQFLSGLNKIQRDGYCHTLFIWAVNKCSNADRRNQTLKRMFATKAFWNRGLIALQ